MGSNTDFGLSITQSKCWIKHTKLVLMRIMYILTVSLWNQAKRPQLTLRVSATNKTSCRTSYKLKLIRGIMFTKTKMKYARWWAIMKVWFNKLESFKPWLKLRNPKMIILSRIYLEVNSSKLIKISSAYQTKFCMLLSEDLLLLSQTLIRYSRWNLTQWLRPRLHYEPFLTKIKYCLNLVQKFNVVCQLWPMESLKEIIICLTENKKSTGTMSSRRIIIYLH